LNIIKSLLALVVSVFDYVKSLIKEIFYLLLTVLNGRNQRKTALLVVQIAGIGDLIVGNSILPHLRRLYPDHHIAYLVKKSHTPLIEGCPFIDEIIEYPEKTISTNLKVRWSFFSRIAKSGFDIVIYPYRSRTISVEEIIFLASARETISYEGNVNGPDADQYKKNMRKYTKLFPHDQEATHELDTHKLFLEWLGCQEINKLTPLVWTADNDQEIAGKCENTFHFDWRSRPYVIFFLGALSSIRYWQISKYIEIGQKIFHRYPDISIAICGGPNEVILGKEICGKLQGDVMDLCGKTDLRELAFLLKNSDLYLGSETGAYHLAVALGTPNICILGGGMFGKFAPYHFELDRNMSVYKNMDCFGCYWNCCYYKSLCIENISTEMVWDKVVRVLDNPQRFQIHLKKALNE
jgi:heptosyltransferase-1